MRALPRRQLAAFFAAAPAAVPTAARAFRTEPAGAALNAEYGEAASCGTSEAHEQLRAEVARLTPPGQPVPESLLRELERLSRCPLCGCSVLAAEALPSRE
jgi:hypothetical protein